MNETNHTSASTSSARKLIYALVIFLALVLVPWTFYAQRLFKKGDSLRVEGKYVEAADVLKKAQAISLSFQVSREELSKAYLDIAGALSAQDRPDFALCEDLCKRAIALSRDPAQAHRELSDIYYQQKKYDDSLSEMAEYVKLRGNDVGAKKLLDGRTYFATHAKATDMVDSAAKLKEQGKLDEAIAAYERATKEYGQFPFVRKEAAKAYVAKYAKLPLKAQGAEGGELLNRALAVLEKNDVNDTLKAALGKTEEIEKKPAHYKLAAIYTRLGDLDKAIVEYSKHVEENPGDNDDALRKALAKAKARAEEDARRSVPSGVGGQMGAPVKPGEMRDFMAGAAGGFRERFKHTIALTQIIRKLARLEGDAAISAEQAAKLLPILNRLGTAEKMSQEDAKSRVATIKDILSETQLGALERIERPRRGKATGGRGGARGPGRTEQRGGFQPDANPFARDPNKSALKELIESLKEEATR